MKYIITIIFIIPLFCQAQSAKFNDTMPEAYKIDISGLREHIYAGIPKNLKEDIYENMSYVFADQSAVRISNKISSGRIYNGWTEMEDYLNSILKRIIPKELEKDSIIHVYVVKEGDFNATMAPSGHIFFNVGVFADVNDEASIACIIAHELAHYIKRHGLNMYIERRTGAFDDGLIPITNNDLASTYSINQELQADSLSMAIIKRSGYNLNALKKSFDIMIRLENNMIKRSSKITEIKETTHPNTSRRQEKLDQYISRNSYITGNDYLVDEEKFKKLKEEAKPEILDDFLSSFNYNNCIETAFKFHILDPNNPIYVHYIIEAIRRESYLNIDFWNKPFITNRYYEDSTFNKFHYKIKMKDNIFSKLDKELLNLDEQDVKNIKTNFYWEGNPKFQTNEEAFIFYYKVSQILKDNEAILSYALAFTNNKEFQKKYLELYLGKNDIKHREYAQSLLHDSLYVQLKNNKLVVLNYIDTKIHQGKIDIPIRNQKTQTQNGFKQILDSIKVEANDKKIYLPDLKYFHLNDYNNLLSLQIFSLIPIFANGYKTQLHILDPTFWEIFKKYEVNEIEYITCSYLVYQDNNKSMNEYKKCTEKNYYDLLMQSNSTRYFESFVSSVREIKKGVMKVKQYSGSNKLKSNETGYAQIISKINDQRKQKEKLAEKFDKYYFAN